MPFDINTTATNVLEAFGKQAEGKTFIITGPSHRSIGAQVALSLATANPALLILAGRNPSNITPVISAIADVNPKVQTKFVALDLLSHASVRAAVEQIKAITSHVDVLVNNAGVMAPKTFVLSEYGVEGQFAANYLGHFLFTNLLLRGEGLIGDGGLVLNVGSLGYQMADIDFEDVNFSNSTSYNGWKAYGQSKSAQLLGTRGLANRVKDKNITVLIAHPGVTLESSLLANSGIDQEYFGEAYVLAVERNGGNPLPPQVMVSIEQAAGVVLYTALNPELRGKHGSFIVENQIYGLTRGYADNDVDADRLWGLSERLVGERFVV